jgi:hypothetical protein
MGAPIQVGLAPDNHISLVGLSTNRLTSTCLPCYAFLESRLPDCGPARTLADVAGCGDGIHIGWVSLQLLHAQHGCVPEILALAADSRGARWLRRGLTEFWESDMGGLHGGSHVSGSTPVLCQPEEDAMTEVSRCPCGRVLLAILLMMCVCPSSFATGQPFFAVQLSGGQGRSYLLSEVERITFGSETLEIATAGGTDVYALESIVRVDLELDEWAGADGPEGPIALEPILHLFQNQPNPFSPETRIAFELPQTGPTELRIYTANGRLVRTLVDRELSAGPHSFVWDGLDESGTEVSSGVYFYLLTAPELEESRKMLLVR